ncbi:group III truncated hemoglobin [Lysobacter sp. A3-1-A15]|uniref:group III truncated hemoglobin n=1 Tax=Novilysobacter viscosus TaxID=3098602 RepID=UPI002ED7B34D
MPDHAPLDEHAIATLVARFYDRVRRDPELGPVFNAAVHDWDAHKATLVDFWCSVALRAARYRGNPMAAHRGHHIHAEHFTTWLALWERTAMETVGPDNTRILMDIAERISGSLQYGLGLDPKRRPLGLSVIGR